MVAGDDDHFDPRRGQSENTPGELTLVRGRGIAGLVDVSGEDNQVNPGRDRPVDRLIERAEKIVQPLVQPSFWVDPPVVLHPDMRIRQMRNLQNLAHIEIVWVEVIWVRGALRAPLGPVAAPALRAYALLPAPTPRRRAVRPTSYSRSNWCLSRRRLCPEGVPSAPAGRLGDTTNISETPHRRGEHVRGGWGREGARSEARAKQRLAPGGRAALPLTRTNASYSSSPKISSYLRARVSMTSGPSAPIAA